MTASPRAAASAPPTGSGPVGGDGTPPWEDDVRALIALAALGGPDRLSHEERLALGRALEASPALRAELRALAAVAAALPPAAPAEDDPMAWARAIPEPLLDPTVLAVVASLLLLFGVVRLVTA